MNSKLEYIRHQVPPLAQIHLHPVQRLALLQSERALYHNGLSSSKPTDRLDVRFGFLQARKLVSDVQMVMSSNTWSVRMPLASRFFRSKVPRRLTHPSSCPSIHLRPSANRCFRFCKGMGPCRGASAYTPGPFVAWEPDVGASDVRRGLVDVIRRGLAAVTGFSWDSTEDSDTSTGSDCGEAIFYKRCSL